MRQATQQKLKQSTLTLCLLLICSSTAFSKEAVKSESAKLETEKVLDFDKKWNYASPEKTAEEFRKMLAAAPSASWDYKAQLLSQIARTHSMRSQFDECHSLLDELEAALKVNDFPVAEVRYNLERGRAYNSAGDKSKAVKFFTQAYEKSKVISADSHTIDALHMLGIADEKDKALEWNLLAIESAEKSQSSAGNKWLSPLYNNTGWTYHEMGEFGKALELFEKNLRLSEESKFPVAQQEIAKWTVARCYRSLKRYDDAMTFQVELENAKSLSGTEDGYVYEEIAELLLIDKAKEQSSVYFSKAYTVLSKDIWLMKNEAKRMERIQKLSK